MDRIKQLFCAGICWSVVVPLYAQTVPKKTSRGEVMGYSLNEQKKWEMQQLPRNPVLYNPETLTAPYFESGSYSFKKHKLGGIRLGGMQQPLASDPTTTYLKSFRGVQDLPCKKKYWWSDTTVSPIIKILPDSKTN